MTGSRTAPGRDAAAFLAAVEPEARRAEAMALDALFPRVTGWEPVLWGAGLVGYGRYRYRYESGREGEALATGFAPRAREHSVYIMPGYADHGAILRRLGPHRMGKSCLYVRRLSEIDMGVLEELVRAGLEDLRGKWPVPA